MVAHLDPPSRVGHQRVRQQRIIARPSTRSIIGSEQVTPGQHSAVSKRPNTRLVGSRLTATARGVTYVSLLAAGGLFGLLAATGRAHTAAGVIGVPVAAVAVRAMLRRWVQPLLGDEFTALLFSGFALRVLASVPRLLGAADALVYQREGVRLAAHFRALDFMVETGRSVPGTGSLRYLAGLVSVATGSTYVLTFLVFVVIGFVGQVFIVLASRTALTDGQFRLFVMLMMWCPTLAFWPSSIGKESVMLFGIGLAFLGMSQIYLRNPRGFVALFTGIFTTVMIRPHVAMIVASGALGGLCARRAVGRGKMLAQIGAIALVIVGASFVASASATVFGLESLDGLTDVSAALDFTEARTSQDASQFRAARIESPLDYPLGFVTVLFRPFPTEATNLLAFVNSLEGVAFASLMLAATPSLVRNNLGISRSAVLLFSVVYIAVFVFLFSAVGNFGILSRQRAQVVPFVFLLIALGLGSYVPTGRGGRLR